VSLLTVVPVARKRGERGDVARASTVSSFVVRQQTKRGRWLRLRVMLASYGTSSGHLVLCLSHVIGCESTHHAVASSNDRHHRTLSQNASSSHTTDRQEMRRLPLKLQTTTAGEHRMDRPVETAPLDGGLESKASLCWTTADLYLAWTGSSETATDRACRWQVRNDKRRHSCAPDRDEWSKQYAGPARLAADEFVGSYQDNCTQLQQLLNAGDSLYDVTAAHSHHQSAYAVDVPDRNVYDSN